MPKLKHIARLLKRISREINYINPNKSGDYVHLDIYDDFSGRIVYDNFTPDGVIHLIDFCVAPTSNDVVDITDLCTEETWRNVILPEIHRLIS